MKTETEILGSDDLHAATLRRVGPSKVYPDLFAHAPPGLIRRMLHNVVTCVLAPWRPTVHDEQAARDERGLNQFRSDLTVLPAKDANVITLSYERSDGHVAAETLNTMLTVYAAMRTRLYNDPQLETIRREADAGANAVSQAERRLADFKRDHAISDADEERNLLLHRRSQASQTISDAEASSSEYQARLEALGRALKAEPATIGVFQEQDADARLLSVNAGLQDLRAKLAAARDKYKDTSRAVTALRAQIMSSEGEATRLSRNASSSVVRQGRNPTLDPLRLDRARASAELAASEARSIAARTQARQIDAELVRLDSDEAALAALQRRKISADQDFREAGRILAERHLSEAENARRLSNVRVIQPANVPQIPRGTAMQVVLAGLLMAVLTTFGWIISLFMLRPVFLTGHGLEAATGVPVLAVFQYEVNNLHEQFHRV